MLSYWIKLPDGPPADFESPWEAGFSVGEYLAGEYLALEGVDLRALYDPKGFAGQTFEVSPNFTMFVYKYPHKSGNALDLDEVERGDFLSGLQEGYNSPFNPEKPEPVEVTESRESPNVVIVLRGGMVEEAAGDISVKVTTLDLDAKEAGANWITHHYLFSVPQAVKRLLERYT